jgi:predicted DCC family thiol-disulfide oxidoreductase YuxK
MIKAKPQHIASDTSAEDQISRRSSAGYISGDELNNYTHARSLATKNAPLSLSRKAFIWFPFHPRSSLCLLLVLVLLSLQSQHPQVKVNAFEITSFSTKAATAQAKPTSTHFSSTFPLHVASPLPGGGYDKEDVGAVKTEQSTVSPLLLDVPASSSIAASTTATTSPLSEFLDFDWEPVAKGVFSSRDQRPIVLFDGVCNLCNGGVNFAMDHDAEAKFRFASLQSNVAQALLVREGKHPTKTKTIVLVTPTKAYFSSEAVAKICSQLDPVALKVIGRVGEWMPDWVRESVFKVVSKNRYVLGENDQCRLDFDGEFTSRFVSDPSVVVSNDG